MRILAIALVLACASAPPEPAATTVASSLHVGAAPEPPATPEAARRPAAAAGTECAGDSDCALTRIPDGGCCATLCTPRAVLRATADALQAHAGECMNGKACPLPPCAPPRAQHVAACVSGRCIAQAR
jgi:hypothetical protein